jgi:hypothetical protein
MQSADDAIIRAWTDEIISNPNAYVLARVDEVDSKPKFGPFDERLKHPQIQSDMIPLVAHGIADATTWIAFLPTTDEKIDTLNRLIEYYKRQKKSTWKNEQEDMDERIKKITAIDIFILMWKDLRSRLQTEADTRRPSLFKGLFSRFSRTSEPKTKEYERPPETWWGPYEAIDDGSLGGSKRRKSNKSKKSKRTKKSMNKRNSMKSRRIRRTRKSHV